MSHDEPQLPLDDAAEVPDPGPGQRQVVLVKRGQRYIFRYTPGDESSVLTSLVAMAKDPACPLDWYDAAVLSHQMGREIGQQLQRLAPR